MSVLDFTIAVLSLATRFRFSVKSWGRSEKHNHDVGGVADSLHLVWLAMDVELDQGEDKTAFIAAAQRQGLVVVDDGGYLHLQIPRIR
jgi:hypothetical protein